MPPKSALKKKPQIPEPPSVVAEQLKPAPKVNKDELTEEFRNMPLEAGLCIHDMFLWIIYWGIALALAGLNGNTRNLGLSDKEEPWMLSVFFYQWLLIHICPRLLLQLRFDIKFSIR
jgi:hypothetical protein